MYPRRDISFSIGNSDAPVRIVIFHGYTGSTDEFEPLAQALAATLNAHVSIPLLPGHGTNEADLLHREYEDFARFALAHAARERAKAEKLIFIGHSFGGYLAMECAAAYNADALVLTVVPFGLRFPLNMPGVAWFMRRKLLWEKKVRLQERIERIGLFYYRHMPGIALSLLNEGVRRSKRALKNIPCPILAINTTEDPLTYQKSGSALLSYSGKNVKNRFHIVERKEHGLFYGAEREKTVEEIVSFLKNSV